MGCEAGMRQVNGVRGRYKVGKRGARQVQDRYNGNKAGTRKVKGVRGGYEVGTRGARQVQDR